MVKHKVLKYFTRELAF